MPDEPDGPEARTAKLEKAQQIIYIAYLAVGVVGSVWILWEFEKDNPLGWPAQLKAWWERRAAEREQRRREFIDAGNLVLEAALFLERLREAGE